MRAKKKDGNHKEIERAFVSEGWTCYDMTHQTYIGCDLKVCKLPGPEWGWIEIKNGKGNLTSNEKRFQADCMAKNAPHYIARSVDDVPIICREILLRFAV